MMPVFYLLIDATTFASTPSCNIRFLFVNCLFNDGKNFYQLVRCNAGIHTHSYMACNCG